MATKFRVSGLGERSPYTAMKSDSQKDTRF